METTELQETRIDTAWGNYNAEELKALLEAQSWWITLPPALRLYYALKGYYYMQSRAAAGVIAAVLLLTAGLVAYATHQNLALTLLFIFIGLILGAVAIWEIERRR